MKLLSIRYCVVSPGAKAVAEFLDALGVPRRPMEGMPPLRGPDAFAGAIFPAGDGSWVELWPQAPDLPPGSMLQLVVDDADAFAERARACGLEVRGPEQAHGERIYFARAPDGSALTFQSLLAPAHA